MNKCHYRLCKLETPVSFLRAVDGSLYIPVLSASLPAQVCRVSWEQDRFEENEFSWKRKGGLSWFGFEQWITLWLLNRKPWQTHTEWYSRLFNGQISSLVVTWASSVTVSPFIVLRPGTLCLCDLVSSDCLLYAKRWFLWPGEINVPVCLCRGLQFSLFTNHADLLTP